MKSNRMFGILCILLEQKKITAKELASYFEVSVRTIHRDFLDLSSAGFPVTAQQGIGGGISLMPDFCYSKSALNRDDMDFLIAAIQGLASIDDQVKIKTLLAKLRFSNEDHLLLENDVIIDFTSWNQKSTLTHSIKKIRSAIAGHQLLEMCYYSGSGYSRRTVEPYKLIFKEENWYLFAYCTFREDFRIFKVNRITDLKIRETTFVERKNYKIPSLNSQFANNSGVQVSIRMDQSFEFLAIDLFGFENINTIDNNLFITFSTENPQWVISTIASLGNKAEILEPDSLRKEMKQFLNQAKNLYEI
ncbi:WYL domain-containing protein [Robinsoniella sp. RHS]|uniref:helix-turn-helix transcriptional regulator n=1 Tax=Robinsoniella sp. RHS TaxID=1504536 RepID=UPI00064A82D4